MRTTIALDDELVKAAQEYSGLKEKSAVVRLALKDFVQRAASRKLAELGGTMPDLKDISRRREDSE